MPMNDSYSSSSSKLAAVKKHLVLKLGESDEQVAVGESLRGETAQVPEGLLPGPLPDWGTADFRTPCKGGTGHSRLLTACSRGCSCGEGCVGWCNDAGGDELPPGGEGGASGLHETWKGMLHL